MTTYRRLKPRCLAILDAMTGARRQGRLAREKGEPITSNPIGAATSAAHDEWNAGWREKDEELRGKGAA